MRRRVLLYVDTVECGMGGGSELRPEALKVTFAGRTIADHVAMPLAGLAEAMRPASAKVSYPSNCFSAQAHSHLSDMPRRALQRGHTRCPVPWRRHCTRSGSAICGSGSPPPNCPAVRCNASNSASELERPKRGHTLYVLDEPTTGGGDDDQRAVAAGTPVEASRAERSRTAPIWRRAWVTPRSSCRS